MSPLYANQTILYNIINIFLLATGLIGLFRAKLIFVPKASLENHNIARVVGFIFLLPVLFNTLGLTSWFDVYPAVLCILGAFTFIQVMTVPPRSQTFQFWFIAIIPAICLFFSVYTATQLTNFWGKFIEFGRQSELSESSWTFLLLVLFKFLLPVITAFIANIITPVVMNVRQGLFFALPAFLFYVQYSVTGWILPTLEAFQHSELPYPNLIPFSVVDTFVGLSLLLSISFAGWLGSKIRRQYTYPES